MKSVVLRTMPFAVSVLVAAFFIVATPLSQSGEAAPAPAVSQETGAHETSGSTGAAPAAVSAPAPAGAEPAPGSGAPAPSVSPAAPGNTAAPAPAATHAVRETPSEPVAEAAVAASVAGAALSMPTMDETELAKRDADAERLAEEMRAKREQESIAILRDAEDFVAKADEQVLKLPYPVNLLFAETFFNIPLWRYVAVFFMALACIFLLYFYLRFVKKIRLIVIDEKRVSRWRQVVRIVLVALRNPMKIILPALLLRGGSHMLVTSYHPDLVWISSLMLFLGGTLFVFDLVGVIDRVYGDRIFHSNNRLMDTIRPMILTIARLLILIIAGMHIYQGITGQTMFSVLAGLGLGGLALALASQETLKNLLGFASIAFDKTFLVGDPVSIANYDGVVEHIGIRSLQLRTYNGNRVVIPNATAINSNIVNLNRRPYIRREIRIDLSPANSCDKVEEAIRLIQEVVNTHEGKLPGKPPVVRFADFEPARLVIQAMFWYDASLPDFYDECSRINLEICRRLSGAEVKYAER